MVADRRGRSLPRLAVQIVSRISLQLQHVATQAYRPHHRNPGANAYVRDRLPLRLSPAAVDRVAKTSSTPAAALTTSSSAAYSTRHKPTEPPASRPCCTTSQPRAKPECRPRPPGSRPSICFRPVGSRREPWPPRSRARLWAIWPGRVRAPVERQNRTA